MHISEGVLSPAVLGAGAVLAAAGIVIGLRKLDYDRLMTVAILAAAFFVGSLIHVPIGPSSVHLILNGLLGMLLGWAAAGGALGGVLAMQLFRHKTLHRHFSVGMPVMLAVQLLLGAAVQLWL